MTLVSSDGGPIQGKFRPQDFERYQRYRSSSSVSAHGPKALPDRSRFQDLLNHKLPGFQWSSKPNIAVDPVALINTECIAVTSAMRKHARWAQSSVSVILGAGLGSEVAGSSTSGQENGISPRTIQESKGDSLFDGSLASRWGLRGKKAKSVHDNPLMSAFARLRNDLRGCTDIQSFDTPSLLHPFLQVIRSSSTSAPITSLAIVAITKFFAYSLISSGSLRLPLAMQLLSAAITHCRFEASDSTADDLVLLQILRLMEGMLSGPGGSYLSDESVCEMMETGLSMCCQIRLSELLRCSAQMSMATMCQIVFERLKLLESEAGDDFDVLNAESDLVTDGLKMDPSASTKNTVNVHRDVTKPPHSPNGEHIQAKETGFTHGAISPSRDSVSESRQLTPALPMTENLMHVSGIADDDIDSTSQIKPYGLPSIRELFRVLVGLLEPHDRQHVDTMRIMALRIIDVALEVAGPSIAKHPSLAALAKDDLCRHLFQLVRSEHVGLLNESLRVAGTLLATCRKVLKLQQELFLSYLAACLHPRVEIPREAGVDPALYDGVPQAPKLVKQAPSRSSSGRSTPVPIKDRQKLGLEGGSRKPDAREAMVESIGALLRIPSFLVELFVNYDCEVDRSDLCEDVIGLLSRNAFPDSATWSTTNVPPLCLDALLGYIQFIVDRLGEVSVSQHYPDPEKLRSQRARKKVIIKGATKFNEGPKAGIAYLASQGIIEDPKDPRSVSSFLKGTTRISKAVLGDYLSKKDNEHLLGAFLDLFDFDGKRVDEALRFLLGSFRLPGESALIERIVTVFCEKYCASSTPEEVADKDACFVLTYAIIMLNTDQHNPNLKTQNRMSFNDFARNLRGVNGGNDFATNYLKDIYDSIKANEIILPDEHNNKHAFDYAWKELLVKAKTAGTLVICETNIYDADMFMATWRPIIATLSYVFMSATDDAVFARVVAGFNQCAQIAASYRITDALDRIVFCLSSITKLASGVASNTSLNTEVQAGEKSVMVSELAVKFGRDFKAQLAAVVLFGILSGNEAKLKDGWVYVIRIWLNLFVNSLIPSTFPQTRKIFDIPPIPLQPPSQVISRTDRATDSGLFQAFSSYLSSYAADDPPEPSEEELESTLCTVDCIHACAMDDVFFNIVTLPPPASLLLIQALLEQLPEGTSPVVIVVKPDMPSAAPPRSNGTRADPQGSSYDPAVIYILELATLIAIQSKESVAAVGPAVAEALQNLVRDAVNVHPLVVSRAALYLLHLLRVSHEHTFIRAPVVLHTISSFSPTLLENSALLVLKGLALCVRGASPLRKEIANIPDFWSIIQNLHRLQAAAPGVFDLLENLVTGESTTVTADNYEATIGLLNDFATAGSIGAVIEQKRPKQPRNSKVPKEDKPRESEAVDRGIKAVVMIFQLTNRVPNLIKQSHLERKEAWSTYWSPIFRALQTQCFNPCREIRHQAFSSLQRSLLFPELASTDHEEWTAIFGEVLFPLIMRLLKPEVYQSDPVGMSETRVHAATLLCKIFLHYLGSLSEWDGMLGLWLSILDVMDRLMNSGQGDSLEEAVPESLKNILLVMANSSDSPPSPEFWDQTWRRLDRFLPNLRKEIEPASDPPPGVARERESTEKPEVQISEPKPTDTPA